MSDVSILLHVRNTSGFAEINQKKRLRSDNPNCAATRIYDRAKTARTVALLIRQRYRDTLGSRGVPTASHTQQSEGDFQ
jgi:hypothetical protein